MSKTGTKPSDSGTHSTTTTSTLTIQETGVEGLRFKEGETPITGAKGTLLVDKAVDFDTAMKAAREFGAVGRTGSTTYVHVEITIGPFDGFSGNTTEGHLQEMLEAAGGS